jgi:hypothetical protein
MAAESGQSAIGSMNARGRHQDQGSNQNREGTHANHDQDELKQRHDAHQTVCGARPYRSSGALRTQSPPPEATKTNFSLGKTVAASGNARRESPPLPIDEGLALYMSPG